jgi:hypothetical protein
MELNSIINFGADFIADAKKVMPNISTSDKTSSGMLASSIALRAIGALSALYGTSFLAKSLLGLVSLNPISSIATPVFLLTSIALFIIAHETIKIGYNLRNIANDVQKVESGNLLDQAKALASAAFKKGKEHITGTPAYFDGTFTAKLMKKINITN